jgi:DNA sulfur modification protein DndB
MAAFGRDLENLRLLGNQTMSNKTFIPAFQCSVGDWKYYISMMKYGEVARQVQFAHELSKNAELGQLVQRGLSDRTKEITEYLLTSPHRFLGAIVVAAWGGEPQYSPLSIDDPDGVLRGIDREFGVLTFDGTQQYFALDGQHRLRAIKDAIKQDPTLAKEDICVLMVTHYDSDDGRIRTRRLFSNINRNAVKTNAAEDIVLDEDDGFAVLSRRILDEHPFLKVDGRVKVITRVGEEGLLKLAGNSINKGDPKALTTLPVLYDVLRYLGWDLPGGVRKAKARPSAEVLEQSFSVLAHRLDDLLAHCGDVGQRLSNAANARELRGLKDREGEGHPFMRPVIQKAIARVVGEIVQQKQLSWDDVMERLSCLDWRMSAAPWISVFSPSGGKMIPGKENVDVLCQMLHVHLAPASMQAIKRARKAYKDIRNENYPISEDLLASNIEGVAAPSHEVPLGEPAEELSDQVDRELRSIPDTDDEPA